MLIILSYDGLEYNCVKEFNCKNLTQKCFGKTDIREFSEPRTMVIWASFLTGRNMEREVLAHKDIWSFRINIRDTFLSSFEKWMAIDMPALTQDIKKIKAERDLLKKYFNGSASIEEFDALIFEHHRETKQKFFEALEKDFDILLAYFNLADMIGHLSFGIKIKMKLIYKELDEIAKEARKHCDKLLIISDHGMKALGRYGDHNTYGFWSFSEEIDLKNPKITEFRNFIESFCKT